ncbi:MAG: 5'-nucleotidase C-terminal domain-containing protein [Lewinellaceae bacterium]|nr:5'-nucleotidase C-terminal domain-containing protein [Lewinellaceae bacterium]
MKKLDADLDCREATIRNQQAPVGVDINQAMLSVSRRKPVCAVLNSGSIRVDDVLSGTLTELDVIRMLPFGGGFSEVLMTGDYVKRVLDAGVLNRGTGGYLQVLGAEQMTGTDIWKIGGQPLAPKENYWVVLPDFLLTGNEKNLAFLKTSINADGKTTDNIGILQVDKPLVSDKSDLRSDLRLALIDYWKKH